MKRKNKNNVVVKEEPSVPPRTVMSLRYVQKKEGFDVVISTKLQMQIKCYERKPEWVDVPVFDEKDI